MLSMLGKKVKKLGREDFGVVRGVDCHMTNPMAKGCAEYESEVMERNAVSESEGSNLQKGRHYLAMDGLTCCEDVCHALSGLELPRPLRAERRLYILTRSSAGRPRSDSVALGIDRAEAFEEDALFYS